MGIYQSIDQVRSARVLQLHQWWTTHRRDDIPDRADFDPVNFPVLLPNILIADVEHHPFRIRYRLVGAKVIEATGFNIAGHYLDELMPTEPEAPWMDIYRQSYIDRTPIIGTSTCTTTSGSLFTHEYGLFPVRKGRQSVDQFIALEDYGNLVSKLTDLVHWSERRKPVDFNVRALKGPAILPIASNDP